MRVLVGCWFFCFVLFFVFNSQLQPLAIVWNINRSLGSICKAVVTDGPVRVAVLPYPREYRMSKQNITAGLRKREMLPLHQRGMVLPSVVNQTCFS